MVDARGLYRKFNVTRTDGKDKPGDKHHQCEYFVLDMVHDPHAVAAIRAYAESCKATHPVLSKELIEKYGETFPCDVCGNWARDASDSLAAHHPTCPKVTPSAALEQVRREPLELIDEFIAMERAKPVTERHCGLGALRALRATIEGIKLTDEQAAQMFREDYPDGVGLVEQVRREERRQQSERCALALLAHWNGYGCKDVSVPELAAAIRALGEPATEQASGEQPKSKE